MTKGRFSLLSRAAIGPCLGLFAVCAPNAWAQEAAPTSHGIDEIIVTAQKREESAQRVSVAVSAFDQEQLDRSGVNNINDLSLLVPSLQLSTLQGVTWIFMRGSGNSNPTAGGDNGVAFHYDGVYIGFATAALSDLWDVERVEVLRGPQGTLYGRNSTGGSINVIPNRPGDSFEGSADVTYGDYDLTRVRAAVNLPQMGILRSRLAATYTDRGGYQTNLYPGGQSELDTDHSWSLRGSFGLDFSERTDLLLTLVGAESYGPISAPVRVGDDYPAVHDQIAAAYGLTREPKSTDPRTVNIDTPESTFYQTLGATATLNHDFGPVNFRAIASDYHIVQDTLTDFDGSEINLLDFRNKDEIDQYSFEAQLISNGSGPVEWIVGASYFNLTNQRDTTVDIFHDARAVAPPLPFGGIGGVTFVNADFDSNSTAVFGQVGYSFDPMWKLSVGLRYTWDEKSNSLESSVTADPYNPVVAGLLASMGIVVPPGLPPGFRLQIPQQGGRGAEWEAPMGRVALDFSPTDHNLLYASVSRGYKSGGFEVNDIRNPPTEAETVWAYEIGSKNDFFDRQLRLNASVFYNVSSDIQSYLFQPGEINAVYTSVGDGTAWGVEFDYQALLTDDFRLNGSVGYIHSEYDGANTIDVANLAAGAQSIAGNSYLNTPEWSISTGAEYDFHLPMGILTARADWAYRSRSYFTLFEKETESQASYSKVDLRLILTAANERWNVEGYVNNATDEDVIRSMIVPGGDLGATPYAWYAPPRTWGVRLGVRF